MDDRKIQGMLTTVKEGSFNKAADALGCTQSSMTQMMNSLERELGCQIFIRSHSGVNLTPEGEYLLPRFQEANNAFCRLRYAAERIISGSTVIRIGTYDSLSKRWLPSIVREFRQEHPSIILKIRVGAASIPEWLKNGDVDLALIDEHRRNHFQWIPLFKDPLLAVIPRSLVLDSHHTVTLEWLARHPFIVSPSIRSEAVVEQLSALQNEQPIFVDSNDDETLLSMVAQGIGSSVLPSLSIHGNMEKVRVLQLDPPMNRTVGIALPGESSQATSNFIQYLKMAGVPSDTQFFTQGGKTAGSLKSKEHD